MIIAHRGASKERPENTIAAIQRAIDLGAPFVEIDIRLSKDDIPVLLHDPSAARMMGVNKAANIRQLSLDLIKAIDIAGQSIPTLDEVLNLSWKDTGLMIEIKKGIKDEKKLVDIVFRVIEKVKILPPIVIGSFSLEIMKAVKDHPSREFLGIEMIGIVEKQKMIIPFLELDVKRLALWHPLITAECAEMILNRGVEIWVFTVDDPEIAKFLISLGVKGIISNDPKSMKILYISRG